LFILPRVGCCILPWIGADRCIEQTSEELNAELAISEITSSLHLSAENDIIRMDYFHPLALGTINLAMKQKLLAWTSKTKAYFAPSKQSPFVRRLLAQLPKSNPHLNLAQCK